MALISMTGFGSAVNEKSGIQLEVEIRSVNSRFLDLSVRLPQVYSKWEQEVSKLVNSKINRGRVEVSVARKDLRKTKKEISFNQSLFKAHRDFGKNILQAEKVFDQAAFSTYLLQILQRRDVLDILTVENNVEKEKNILRDTVIKAVDSLLLMRRREGMELEKDLLSCLSRIQKNVLKISKLTADSVLDFEQRLRSRIKKFDIGTEIDPQRLTQEIALLADRVDVNEELARFSSHLTQFQALLHQGDSGKKLEFLIQEINREINTIGSKSQNVKISGLVINCKAEIERLREQVQNVE